MPVVSNTSPILNLAIVDHLHLEREQSTEIMIPLAVLDELRPNAELPGSHITHQAVEQG